MSENRSFTPEGLAERLNNAAEGCLSLGYGRELYDLMKEAAAQINTPSRSLTEAQIRKVMDEVRAHGHNMSNTVILGLLVADGHLDMVPSERGEGWIQMKERQPADFERVLCVNSAGYMTTANRFHDTKLDCWNGSDYTAEEQQELVIGGITHWMRLPEPPK